MNIDNIVPSTLKVIASENLHIENDLNQAESNKTLDQLIHDQKENSSEKEENS